MTATFWLLYAPDSLAMQSHREPDGTGLGYFDNEGKPHIAKQPIAAYEDRTFTHTAQKVKSGTFVAHIRFASTGAIEMRNTHPFLQHNRIFAHNGVIEDLPKLERHIGPDAMKLVAGDTDSERFFALISKEIDRADGNIAAGITAAVRWVAENLPVFALNFILSTKDEIWALRYPQTHPLFVLQRRAGGHDTRTALKHASSMGTRIVAEDRIDQPCVVFASEKLDDEPAWRPMRLGELIHVNPELEVSSRLIIDTPPRQLLKLSDLGGQAAASQTETKA